MTNYSTQGLMSPWQKSQKKMPKYTIEDLIEGPNRIKEIQELTIHKKSGRFKDLERKVKQIRTTERGRLTTYVMPSVEQDETREKRYEKIFKGHTWSRLYDMRNELHDKLPSLLESENKEISRVFGNWNVYNKKDLQSFYNSLDKKTSRVKKSSEPDSAKGIGKPLFFASLLATGSLAFRMIGKDSASMEMVMKEFGFIEKIEEYTSGLAGTIITTGFAVAAGIYATVGIGNWIKNVKTKKRERIYKDEFREETLILAREAFKDKNFMDYTISHNIPKCLDIAEEIFEGEGYLVSRKGNSLTAQRKPVRKKKPTQKKKKK